MGSQGRTRTLTPAARPAATPGEPRAESRFAAVESWAPDIDDGGTFEPDTVATVPIRHDGGRSRGATNIFKSIKPSNAFVTRRAELFPGVLAPPARGPVIGVAAT
jgi:hypothetical protein